MQETWVWSLSQEDPPGEGNGNPLQYSCQETSMDRGAWWAMVHGSQRVGHDWVTNTFFFSFTGLLVKHLGTGYIWNVVTWVWATVWGTKVVLSSQAETQDFTGPQSGSEQLAMKTAPGLSEEGFGRQSLNLPEMVAPFFTTEKLIGWWERWLTALNMTWWHHGIFFLHWLETFTFLHFLRAVVRNSGLFLRYLWELMISCELKVSLLIQEYKVRRQRWLYWPRACTEVIFWKRIRFWHLGFFLAAPGVGCHTWDL